jgi:pilus assembly protein CpaE
LKASPSEPQIVVILHNANITVSRQLAREGAADVLPAPVSEMALALCLERLLQRVDDVAGDTPSRTGEVVAFIKGGGGVGATSLATQAAVVLARRNVGSVCLADLDLQFGAAAAYLDLPDSFNLLDALNLGQAMGTAHLSSILAEHRSGLRVLAAPKDMSPIDAVKPAQIDALIALLRSEYDLSLLDLPSVWTTWSLQAVAGADRIVLVGQLTVPSIQLIGRQLKFLNAQKLDQRPITLVCNACSPDQLADLPLKVAEKSLGRPFDVVTPLDAKAMTAAVNQGRPLDEARRGTKLEKAIGQLADKLRATAPAATARRWF